ncbi:hypothetical protein [Brevibacillus brevis]|uniref:Uncharacterized protein n=1 Tax=Brevibacillus brevis TaxID=1393 RepID=A0ABY9T8F7_BREBE|nr:hypothetical protein [Brevibacillus brevis]WNC16316.1 hypothetical protein RGB73_08380 [Brevibacillus brevis]
MKKKMVLVLDVEVSQSADMQTLADEMAKAIGAVDAIALHEVILFDNDESSADKWVANLEAGAE